MSGWHAVLGLLVIVAAALLLEPSSDDAPTRYWDHDDNPRSTDRRLSERGRRR